MTPEQRKARRQELAAMKKAAEDLAVITKRHREVLAKVYHEDTGEYADDEILAEGTEYQFDSSAFVDWLILRYVAAAGSAYAMTEADKKGFAETLRRNESNPPSKEARELVGRYVWQSAPKLVCDSCHMAKPDVQEVEDPYIKEINEESVLTKLCDDCMQNRMDDI